MPDPVTLDAVRAVPGVDSAERLDLRPGDAVVVRVAPGVDNAGIAETAERLGSLLDGTGVKCIVAKEGVAIGVERFHTEPGDVLVFRVGKPSDEHHRLTDHEYGTAMARIRATLGDGVRFVLLDGDMRLDRVLAQEAAEQLAAGGRRP